MHRLLILLSLVTLTATAALAQSADDHEGVRSAVEDYLVALYDVEPERIDRSVSTDLVKFGWWRSGPDADYAPAPMSFEQLRGLASRWNTDNRMGISEETPRQIEVLDVLDKTAVAKLTAFWGIDYMQLEKIEGKWMIRHVLWQSHPLDQDHSDH